MHGAVDAIGGGVLQEVAEHHHRALDERQRIGDVLARDVGRAAVHGLEDRPFLAEVGSRNDSQSTHQAGAKVGEDVAVEVLGQENVELLRPGQTIAIVGPTGAGKTTLTNLVLRFYDIQGGRILLDDVDISHMDRNLLRKNFGVVLQDTWLFKGTIRENIAYGAHRATEEQVMAAAEAAYVDHFVRTLPDGYDTVIEDEGTNVSAGQRQLLTIARAFLANPAILVLDEATSSVDTRTEALVQGAMEQLRSGRTSFVIAHRLSTIRDAMRAG